MLEKQIEHAVCEYAKRQGILVYKFTSPSRAAVPDRLFILPGGKTFFIEFKRTGEKATPQQQREHHRLTEWGVPVFVVDDVELGIARIQQMVHHFK